MNLITLERLTQIGISEETAKELLLQMEQDLSAARAEGEAHVGETVASLTAELTALRAREREWEIAALFDEFGLKASMVREAVRALFGDEATGMELSEARSYLQKLKESEPMLFEDASYPRFAGALCASEEEEKESLGMPFLRLQAKRRAACV